MHRNKKYYVLTFCFRLFNIWEARTPKVNSTLYKDAISKGFVLSLHGEGRSAGEQAGYQAAALFVTLIVSIIGGLFTG